MAQAESKHSTRRSILATGAALVAVPTMTVAAAITPDPIYAAIESVKRAEAAIEPVLHRLAAAETRYRGQNRLAWYAYECGNYPPLDPKGPADWLAVELEQGVVWTAYDDAAKALLNTKPATVAGLATVFEFLRRERVGRRRRARRGLS